MTPIFKKLNLKDQTDLIIINTPESFEIEIDSLQNVTIYRAFKNSSKIQFVLVFLTSFKELENIANLIKKKPKSDVIIWIAYPKKSSKKLSSEINRDTDWSALGKIGFEGVRAVAIDDDWSALRFRRVEFIKKMKRDPKRALTDEGKNKISD